MLSGGSQRKANVALALLAGHRVLLLDEPSTGKEEQMISHPYILALQHIILLLPSSPPLLTTPTGMDPNARRARCSALHAAGGERAIILSTHAMEEADALCTHIAIMVAGQLRCFGSPQVWSMRGKGGCGGGGPGGGRGGVGSRERE